MAIFPGKKGKDAPPMVAPVEQVADGLVRMVSTSGKVSCVGFGNQTFHVEQDGSFLIPESCYDAAKKIGLILKG